VSKLASNQLSSTDLEKIFSEIEARVERKFETRISRLEDRCRELAAESNTWRLKYLKEQENSREIYGQLQLANAKIAELEVVVETQRSQIQSLNKKLFGRSSEALPEPIEEHCQPKRSRGRQVGAKGHGRKRRTSIEAVDCVHDFPHNERLCQLCGLPYEDFGEKTSEVIHLENKLVRLVHRRKKIRKTCKCSIPTIKTAPGPPKLFRGSLLSTATWSYVIYDKYHLQRPTSRTLQFLETLGLPLSQGMITNGLKRLHNNQVFRPLVEAIKQRVSSSSYQQKDETGWKVFQELEGKKSYQWYLWATLAKDCTYFQIDPSRSREVAKQTIGEDPVVLSTDRLSSYRNLGKNVTNAWCWAHIRRHLLELRTFRGLRSLSDRWVAKVGNLYHLNGLRLAADDANFNRRDKDLRAALADFERQVKRNAVRTGMHEKAKKVFKSIAKDWDGLTVFVELPAIPMDNNASENALRNSVVGKKCYYGSGSHWSAHFAADLFTIFTTLEQNGINSLSWLNEYLHAVACNNGKAPEDALSFLPWNTPNATLLSN